MSEKAILLHTDFMGEEKKIEIKDGKAVIDDKEFIMDRPQPFLLKSKRLGRTTLKPLYIMKWDKVEPVQYVVNERQIDGDEYAELQQKGLLKTLEVKFPTKDGKDVLPFYLRETHDQRYLRHMKKYSTEGQGKAGFGFKRWMLIPIAFLISGGIMFALNYFHIFG